jgi:citrate lyase beta subunit
MRARRALLYMPGDDIRKIQKAAGLEVDCVCMDMEDGVALNRKAEARRTILHALQNLDFGRSERLARINPAGSGLETEDIITVLPGLPDGIVLPKVKNASDIQWADNIITEFLKGEKGNSGDQPEINIIAIIETAQAFIDLREIASSSSRLKALIFGAEDLANDLGAVRTRDAWEIHHARSSIVLHAAAFNLQAIDMVYMDLHNLEGLREEALMGAKMGFAGKQIIHPNQVEPVQDAFTPSDEEIARARRIVEAFERHQRFGKGAFALDGKMVDAPVVKAAKKVMAKAKAAGKI